MILDRLEHADRYAGAHPAFARAFTFLRTADLRALPAGRVVLDGDRLFANVDDVVGRGEAGARVEAHRRYIDIQLTVTGRERMGWISLRDGLAPDGEFSEERDIGFFLDRPSTWLDVPPGHFAIFWPEDAHAPLAGAGPIRKVVVKVAVAS